MAEQFIRIAIDAMGGDNVPEVLVEGSIAALHSYPDVKIILVGDKKIVSDSLNRHLDLFASGSAFAARQLWRDRNSGGSKVISLKDRIGVVHAEEVIEMCESPAHAIRSKKKSSIVVANMLCRSGDVEAVISAGNTGAAMASSLLYMGRISGVLRPAISQIFPSKKNYVVIVDVGANTDCKPENLYQFGVMASIYASRILGYNNPRVAILSIGEERSKGNDLTKSTYRLFEESGLNFTGNIEGRDIFEGIADVVVCDGFVGNVLLKFGESVFGFVTHNLKKKVSGSLLKKVGAILLKPAFKEIKHDMSPENYGGAPLLGVDGISIICHGNSTPTAIKNAVRVARQLVLEKVNELIKTEFTRKTSEHN